jgi:hypothetical protein
MRRWSSSALFLAALLAGVSLAAQPQAAGGALSDEPSFSAAQLRADLKQMYRELKAAHFDLYAFTPKPDLDRRYQEAHAALNRPMTRFQAQTQFELFAAAVRMGHTRVDSPVSEWQRYRQNGGKAFPLQLRVSDGRAYVTQNLSGVEALQPGDELTSIDGESMRAWLARTERHVSAETRYMADSLMDYDFAIYLWIERGAVEAFNLEARRGTAAARRVRVPARTAAEMDAARVLQPPALDLENPLREAKLLGAGLAYLRPGPFYNAEAKTGTEEWDVSGFQHFIDEAFAGFAAAGSERLIIDLRGNPGGDNLFSDLLVSWIATRPFRFASQFRVKVSEQSIAANASRLAHDAAAAGPISRKYAQLYAQARTGQIVEFEVPLAQPRAGERFTGKVFVLVDRHSYSNAVAVAALLQDYKFAAVLGEPTADMATTFGAMEQFPLANTGLLVGYPKARIVRPNGDLRARGVTPDILIRTPVVQSPSDQVLLEAAAIARGS